MLEVIQNLCKERNLSIFKLEKQLGFGNGTIYKWDKSSPAVDKLKKVADFFGVTVDYLLASESIKNISRITKTVGQMESEYRRYGLSVDIVDGSFFKYVVVDHPDFGQLLNMSVAEFQENGEPLLEDLIREFNLTYHPETIAAHHDGDDWTEEELQDIEEFKELVKLRRQLRKSKE